jgi:hypothetical protein
MKILKNKGWLASLATLLLITTADAVTEAPDVTSDLMKKLSPKEREAIEKEAAKLKEGKTDETTPPATENEQPEEKAAEADKKSDPNKEERERSLRRYETMYQGFYPSRRITQKPGSNITKGSIKPLNPMN